MEQETAYLSFSFFYAFLSLLLVLNRLYVRGAVRQCSFLPWSDGLVAIAWLLIFAQSCCDLYLFTRGGARLDGSEDETNSHDFEKAVLLWKIGLVEYIIYYIPLHCIKAAILSFLWELTPSSFKALRRAIWFGGVLCGIGFIVVPIMMGFEYCRCDYSCPAKTSTTPDNSRGIYITYGTQEWSDTCTGSNRAWITIGAVAIGYHMLTDIYIYIIPFFLVRHLPRTVSLSEKIPTYIMFGLGFMLVCLAAPQMDLGIPDEIATAWNYWWSIHEELFAVIVVGFPYLRVTAKVINERRRCRPDGIEEHKASTSRNSLLVRMRRGDLETREIDHEGSSEKSDRPFILELPKSYKGSVKAVT